MAGMTFTQWLACQTRRRGAVGLLARTVKKDPHWPRALRRETRLRNYVLLRGGDVEAFDLAWAEYQCDYWQARLKDLLPPRA